jgi:nuclear pore complex protein Nup62
VKSDPRQEIISHLNSTAKAQDSRDPVQQIGKVLNAHMDSLQWIDSSAVAVERKLGEVSRWGQSLESRIVSPLALRET